MSALQPYGQGRMPRAVVRRHSQALASVDHAAEIAEAHADAIGAVTEHAQMTLARVDRVRQMATQMAPETAEMQMLLEMDAFMELRGVVRNMGRRR